MRILIIGAGNMGKGIATRAIAGGNTVTLYDIDPQASRSLADTLSESGAAKTSVTERPSDAARDSDIVILASWYGSNLEIAKQLGNALENKIVVDISNPLNETYDGLVTAPDTSAAETIRQALPASASLVKAFNTTFAGTLVAGNVGGDSLDVFIAGDDTTAKETIKSFVQSGGMNAIDTGALERARQLEALGLLGITLQGPLGTGFMSGWKLTMPAAA
jgi:predicted dinucleotide-binding enzyme